MTRDARRHDVDGDRLSELRRHERARIVELAVAVQAEIDASEMARSLGLGESVGDRSRFAGTLDRIVRFGLARPAHDGTGLDVYRLVAPLSERQLSRLPEWTQAAHDRLIVPHLERLSATPTQQSTVADVTAMLDRIQHSRPLTAHAPAHALQP